MPSYSKRGADDVTPVLHHNLPATRILHRISTARTRDRINNITTFLLATPLPRGPRIILTHIASTVLATGLCQPRQTTLARIYRCSRMTISRWLRLLQHRGLIELHRRGRGKPNRYYLGDALWGRLKHSADYELRIVMVKRFTSGRNEPSHISHGLQRVLPRLLPSRRRLGQH